MNLSSARRPFFIPRINLNSGMILGSIIVLALLSFEMFNYSTTDFALRDLLGDLKFFGIQWATILAVAFCAIDFAGVARLFSPQQGTDEPHEIWYLFGAWFLAATMNAMLTWWGVAMAIASHNLQSAALMDGSTMVKVVPVFVAIMVWIIRILIIGTISTSGDSLFNPARIRSNSAPRTSYQLSNSHSSTQRPLAAAASTMHRPSAHRPLPVESGARVEPTYHRPS